MSPGIAQWNTLEAFQKVRQRLQRQMLAGLLLLDKGEIERAVELIELAGCYPVAANSQWFHDVAGREILEAAESPPPEMIAAAQAQGRARDIWEAASGLLAEFSK